MNEQSIHRVIGRAVNYLVHMQSEAGSWEEYDLPIGHSNAWVTAYVGLALAQISRLGLPTQALLAAQHAATWLVNKRSYAAGWGYNDKTGPDANSTAYVLLLLKALGFPCLTKDVDWLLACWQPNGGCSTYVGLTAWGVAHPDVTPVAFCALPSKYQRQLRPVVSRYLATSRHPDGTWPAYWWRTCHYSTYLNLSLGQKLGLVDFPRLLINTKDPTPFIRPLIWHL